LARINLRKFIAEHYKGGVTARDVVREAVTNSIHAGGTKISVDLRFSEKQTELLDLPSERAALRANKRETTDWLKFTLEGAGERTHGYAFTDTTFAGCWI
jgi:aspartate oxidase